MKINLPAGLSGHFTRFAVRRRDGSFRIDMDGPRNLITDAGLVHITSSANQDAKDVYAWAKLSTDNAQPTPSDTTVPGILATLRDTSDGELTGTPELGWTGKKYKWEFPAGAVVGNVSKVITGWSAAADSTFSSALLLDEDGDPTSVTVLEDEQVVLEWELRLYWPTEDVVTQMINEGSKGGAYECRVRAAFTEGSGNVPWRVGSRGRSSLSLAGNPSNNQQAGAAPRFLMGEVTLGDIGGGPSSTGGPSTELRNTAGKSGQSATATMSCTPLQSNHPDGIGGLLFGTGSQSPTAWSIKTSFQVRFDPPLDKTEDDSLEVDVSVSLSRHDPEDED